MALQSGAGPASSASLPAMRRSDPGGGCEESGIRFRQASRAARTLVVTAILAALCLPSIATAGGPVYRSDVRAGVPALGLVLMIVACSALSVELGRVLEGRLVVGQRPHKALSMWAFACAAVMSPVWLLVVTPVTYAHAYWRGMRPPLWKWVGSAAFVILAGLAAHATVGALPPGRLTNSPAALGALLAAVAAFLGTECLLFGAMSRINHAEQERWLRATLSGPGFYLTEAAMLCVGALSAATWSRSPWYALLLLPVYLLTQQAALFDPLRGEAQHDEKTGLLRYEPWRRASTALIDHLDRDGRGWAVVMLDLDRFTDVNSRHGHLVADDVLGQVGRLLPAQVRGHDLVCRFGGEEFAALICDVDSAAALALAERLRAAVAEGTAPKVTTSVGLAVSGGCFRPDAAVPHDRLRAALVEADRALRDAKTAGRDRVVTNEPPLGASAA